MRVFRDLNNLPTFVGAVATMGSFDGLHSGHNELLRRVINLAHENQGESIVLTFDPHPRYVLGTGDRMQLLTTLDEKLWLLERAGIENVIVINFTKEFSQLSPQEFIEQAIKHIGIRTLVVGYNHRFGHRKAGDYDYLESRCEGLEVHRVEQQQIADSKVSSTIIRQTLSCGMVAKAATLLGHPYIIICEAEQGRILPLDAHKMLPSEGKYEAIINGHKGEIMINRKGEISINPIVDNGKVLIELT